MSDAASPRGRGYRPRIALLDYAEAGVMAGLLGLCSRMPLGRASAIGGGVARAVGPHLARSRIARRNLARVFPEKSRAEIEVIVRGMWEHLGRMAAESAHLRRIRVYDAGSPVVDVQGAEHLERVIAAGRGGLLVSGHIGQWDILQLAVRQRGVDATIVYREINNPVLSRVMGRVREPIGPFLNKGRGAAKAMIEGLRRGRFFSMLVDQKMNDGIAVPFFGRPAMTAPAVAQFAVRDDVALLPGWCERLEGARFRIRIYPPLEPVRTGDRAHDIAATMAKVNALIETWIRERPEQWLWLHRRWPD